MSCFLHGLVLGFSFCVSYPQKCRDGLESLLFFVRFFLFLLAKFSTFRFILSGFFSSGLLNYSSFCEQPFRFWFRKIEGAEIGVCVGIVFCGRRLPATRKVL